MTNLVPKRSFFIIVAVFSIIFLIGVSMAPFSDSDESSSTYAQDLNQIQRPQADVNIPGTNGFNVLSISLIDMESSSPFFSGEKVWVVTVAAGGILNQHGLVQVKASDLGNKTRPQYDFTLEVKSITQTCNFPIITNSAFTIPNNIAPIEWSEAGNCEMENIPPTQTCASPKEWGIFHPTTGEPYANTIICYGLFQGLCLTSDCGQTCETRAAGAVGTLGRERMRTQLTTGLYGGNDNGNYEAYLDTNGPNGTIIGKFGSQSDPKGVVVFNGGILAPQGTVCGNYNDYQAIYRERGVSSPQWQLTSKAVYNDYVSAYNLQRNFALSSGPGPWLVLENYIAQNNNKLDNMLANPAQFGSIYDQSNIAGGVVVEQVSSLVTLPVLTFYLPVDWVGIYTPCPTAEITGGQSACFTPGDQNAVINIDVSNTGTEAGNFQVSAYCPSPFNCPDAAAIGIEAQDQITVHLPIYSNALTQTTHRTATAKVSGCFGEHTFPIDICGDPIPGHCQANTQYCEGSPRTKIMQCNPTGTASTQISDCAPELCLDDVTGVHCQSTDVCNADGFCDTANGETEQTCFEDCGKGLCDSCLGWAMSLFKPKYDRCIPVEIFIQKTAWYDLTGHMRNWITPNWTQDEFCPWALGGIVLIFFMVAILVILILKKKGVIQSSRPNAIKQTLKKITGWRGK